MRRIIQFSTGNVGVHALRSIIERPDLELVGVHANTPDKVGQDAAGLCGLPTPIGITATDDIDALVAPDQADVWLREPLAAACAEGDSTLYINGIDPGFSGDTLVYTTLSLAARATAVTVQEIFDYGSYDDAEFTGVSFGFGALPEHTPTLFTPGILTSMWGAQVRSLAADLGVEPDEVRERHRNWVTPEPIDCTMMRVEPGHVAAVMFGVDGLRDGRAVITMEHVNRLTDAAAPDWPYPPDGYPGVHRVVVDGSPGIEINTHVGTSGIDHNQGGVIATAARAVNVIEAVCRASIGLLSAHDLRATDHVNGVMW